MAPRKSKAAAESAPEKPVQSVYNKLDLDSVVIADSDEVMKLLSAGLRGAVLENHVTQLKCAELLCKCYGLFREHSGSSVTPVVIVDDLPKNFGS